MDELMERAFAALNTLPEQDRARMAHDILDRVEDKTEWDRLIATPQAQKWLEVTASKALKAYKKVAAKMSLQFITQPLDNLGREGAYWDSFDDLPEEIRTLAEQTYRQWKQNPMTPGLRFKQIHQTQPIFSFRVGMKHRTVGVEAPDGTVVWFWVGSFKTFKAQTGM
ncbi:hypothetical protein JCM17960_32070 [Magnetospira thiophila]